MVLDIGKPKELPPFLAGGIIGPSGFEKALPVGGGQTLLQSQSAGVACRLPNGEAERRAVTDQFEAISRQPFLERSCHSVPHARSSAWLGAIGVLKLQQRH